MSLILVASAPFANCDEPMTMEFPSPAWPHVGPVANPNLTNKEIAFNFGAIYLTDWALYLVLQRKTIQDGGRLENIATGWYRPHFDNDGFETNIFQHTVVGQSYYQFYRSRGYEVKRAFLWSFASSFAFEMAIESLTEQPSIQDIYQTPIYGTIVGIGLEKLSQACHHTETALGHICGYIFDPFTLIPNSPKFAVYPSISRDTYAANVSWEF
jgi:hypothetical protein